MSTDFKVQGKLNRMRGARWELKVRAFLETKAKYQWIIDKWTNNVDLKEDKLIKAKNRWRGKNIPMMMGAGFPDFIVYRKVSCGDYIVCGLECKLNGKLSAEEKKKCQWLLKHGIFNRVWIASKVGRNIQWTQIHEK